MQEEIDALTHMAEQFNSKIATSVTESQAVDLDNLFSFLSDVQSSKSSDIIEEIGEKMNELVENLDTELESVKKKATENDAKVEVKNAVNVAITKAANKSSDEKVTTNGVADKAEVAPSNSVNGEIKPQEEPKSAPVEQKAPEKVEAPAPPPPPISSINNVVNKDKKPEQPPKVKKEPSHETAPQGVKKVIENIAPLPNGNVVNGMAALKVPNANPVKEVTKVIKDNSQPKIFEKYLFSDI